MSVEEVRCLAEDPSGALRTIKTTRHIPARIRNRYRLPAKGTKARQGKRVLTITRTVLQSTATTATCAKSADNASGAQPVREDYQVAV